MDIHGRHISERLVRIRELHYGNRGKSRFASDLGIRPSTYDRYERDRIPPADILLRAARVTGTRIEWLLTGEGAREIGPSSESPRVTELVQRIRTLLSRRPDVADHLETLLELLSQPEARSPFTPLVTQSFSREDLIPLVGSTAAGMARFWMELEVGTDGPEADARLEILMADYQQRAVARVNSLSPREVADVERTALVQLSRQDETGFLEFLSAASIRRQYPQAVAWRIDGESMSPRYVDGDIVVTSADVPASPGYPCVARQQGQIGVNCKLFQHSGSEITLVPVNEHYAVQQFPADQLLWAYRVLFAVRLGG